MKILAISGSAREDGNTKRIVDAVLSVACGEDIECETIQLAGTNIHGCRACWCCKDRGNCCFEDDGFFEIFEKMKEADAIVLASPVYVGNISANLQAVLERASVVCDMNNEGSLLSGKTGAALAVARRAGALNTLNVLLDFFLVRDMCVVGSSYWPIAYGQMPGDVERDEEGMKTAVRLGENLRRTLMAFRLLEDSSRE